MGFGHKISFVDEEGDRQIIENGSGKNSNMTYFRSYLFKAYFDVQSSYLVTVNIFSGESNSYFCPRILGIGPRANNLMTIRPWSSFLAPTPWII